MPSHLIAAAINVEGPLTSVGIEALEDTWRALDAYFSDRGRPFQSDRGRWNSIVEGAPGRRASTRVECTPTVHDQPETPAARERKGAGFGGWIDLQISGPCQAAGGAPTGPCTHVRSWLSGGVQDSRFTSPLQLRRRALSECL
jgi:hypothetical protein